MWVVLLDGVGICASPRAGRAAFRGRAAENGLYPVLGHRNDAVASPKPPIRAGGPGVSKAASAADRRLRRRFACRNRFVRAAALPGIPASSSPTGVEFYCVRAAKNIDQSQTAFLTRRETRGDRATSSERPKHSGDRAALIDQRSNKSAASHHGGRRRPTHDPSQRQHAEHGRRTRARPDPGALRAASPTAVRVAGPGR